MDKPLAYKPSWLIQFHSGKTITSRELCRMHGKLRDSFIKKHGYIIARFKIKYYA